MPLKNEIIILSNICILPADHNHDLLDGVDFSCSIKWERRTFAKGTALNNEYMIPASLTQALLQGEDRKESQKKRSQELP